MLRDAPSHFHLFRELVSHPRVDEVRADTVIVSILFDVSVDPDPLAHVTEAVLYLGDGDEGHLFT